jgi:N-acetylmuramoyl-L-alanine amidase
VAANENAPLAFYSGEENANESPDLDFILRELRNLDHQHWSANLAETVQKRLGAVHSGPDRGVKQGPFAVITNVLMPAVLVEIGFVSNREEEREMSRSEFQRKLGRALADAVREFYNRYPPGQQAVGRGGEC